MLIALDWDAAAPVAAVHEAVGVALDWSDAEPSLFAESIEAYVRTRRRRPGAAVGVAGWVAAQGGWLDFNATHRTDSTLHSTEVQTTLARLHQVATRLDALLAALRYR